MADETANTPETTAPIPTETSAAVVVDSASAVPDAPRVKLTFKNEGAMAEAMAGIIKLAEQHFTAENFHDDLKKAFKKQLKTAHDAWEDGEYTPPEGSDALRALKKEQKTAKDTGLYISLGVGLAVGLALAAAPLLAFGVIGAAPGAAAATALVTNMAFGASALTAIGGVVAGWFASETVGNMMSAQIKAPEPTLQTLITDDQKKEASLKITQDRGNALAEDIALDIKSRVANGSLTNAEAEAVLIYLSTATPDTLKLEKPVTPEGEDAITFDAQKMQAVTLRNAREHQKLETLLGAYAKELNDEHTRTQAEAKKQAERETPEAQRDKRLSEKRLTVEEQQLEAQLNGAHKRELEARDGEIARLKEQITGLQSTVTVKDAELGALRQRAEGAERIAMVTRGGKGSN